MEIGALTSVMLDQSPLVFFPWVPEHFSYAYGSVVRFIKFKTHLGAQLVTGGQEIFVTRKCPTLSLHI